MSRWRWSKVCSGASFRRKITCRSSLHSRVFVQKFSIGIFRVWRWAVIFKVLHSSLTDHSGQSVAHRPHWEPSPKLTHTFRHHRTRHSEKRAALVTTDRLHSNLAAQRFERLADKATEKIGCRGCRDHHGRISPRFPFQLVRLKVFDLLSQPAVHDIVYEYCGGSAKQGRKRTCIENARRCTDPRSDLRQRNVLAYRVVTKMQRIRCE